MFDMATRRELAAMVLDRADDALEADEEREILVLAEDCVPCLHAAAHLQHLLLAGR